MALKSKKPSFRAKKNPRRPRESRRAPVPSEPRWLKTARAGIADYTANGGLFPATIHVPPVLYEEYRAYTDEENEDWRRTWPEHRVFDRCAVVPTPDGSDPTCLFVTSFGTKLVVEGLS